MLTGIVIVSTAAWLVLAAYQRGFNAGCGAEHRDLFRGAAALGRRHVDAFMEINAARVALRAGAVGISARRRRAKA